MGSSSKSTHHIKIRFYFIKGSIICKELNAKQCSTGDILADFPSKPLQGSKLKKIQNQIYGCEHLIHKEIITKKVYDPGTENLNNRQTKIYIRNRFLTFYEK